MSRIHKPFTSLFLAIAIAHGNAMAADTQLSQGVHQWPIKGGKLIAVVGTYQDTIAFRHSYNFFFKPDKDDEWNQVALIDESGARDYVWNSASGGEVTLAEGTVSVRPDGAYFIVASKRTPNGYYDKSDITATWYKFDDSEDGEHRDDSPYRLKPVFKHTYPTSALSVENVLAKEAASAGKR